MKRTAAFVLFAVAGVLLFWNLGSPALWQDEAETALRAQSILETGLPQMSLRGTLVTAQPSLSASEGNPRGAWIWNTWVPAYLCATSFYVFGISSWAARLPFALAGLFALILAWRIFSQGESDAIVDRRQWCAEAGVALLALSPAFLLFCRQSRYYALVALGTLVALWSYRRLLGKKPYGALAVALSLNFLLHSSFAFFAITAAALATDAVLRFDECLRSRRYWGAAALTILLALPAACYFRIWDRPGNHQYGLLESLAFLKTFELWLFAFVVPLAMVAAAFVKRKTGLAIGFVLLCGIVAEGQWSLICAVLVWVWLLACAAHMPAPYGVMNLKRMCLLLVVATLGLLSFGAAEPYGRYLAGVLPPLAYLVAREISYVGRGRSWAVAALTILCVTSNLAFIVPLKAAQLIAAPKNPADSVSGMMRLRLREIGLRSDLARFTDELKRGPEGYIETVAQAIKAGGGSTFFSDADSLSLMFLTGLRPIYPEEFKRAEPDWILPSPWLKLSGDLEQRVRKLAGSGRYATVDVRAPRLMWQNNPDPLFRDFSPVHAAVPLLRRR